METRHILILKAAPKDPNEDDPFVSVLTTAGFSVTSLPILLFEFENLDGLLELLNRPEDFSGIVFLSPRTVHAVIECLQSSKIDRLNEKWKNLKMYAVGESTARLLETNLQLSCRGSSSGNSSTLAVDIGKDIGEGTSNKQLLIICGNLHTNEFETALAEYSIPVRKIECYRTIPHPAIGDRLRTIFHSSETPWLVIFFSPSGLQAALSTLEKPTFEHVKIVAIGPTTAAAIQKEGLTVNAVCEKPVPECVLQAVKSVMN